MAEFLNAEHYPDPTPYAAMKNIEREERKAAYRPLVYICSPFAGDVENNVKNAQKYSRYAVEHHAIPFAPHLLFPQFMSEETERELALFMGLVLLSKCSEVWVFGGRISKGMAAEIAKAKQQKKIIRYFTEDLEEMECK